MNTIRKFTLLVLIFAVPIIAYGLADVRVLHELGGHRQKLLDSPGDAAIGADGTIYVVDSGNYRVMYFNSKGVKQGEFGSKGRDKGQFLDPHGIALRAYKVFVSDAKSNLIQVFDTKGKFLYAFGGSGKTPGRLSTPWGIVVSDQDRVYVAEKGAGRISVFTIQGIYLGTIGEDLTLPSYLAIDRSGKLYVSDTRKQAIIVIDPNGKIVKEISSKQSGISNLSGVAVNDRGWIIAADCGGSRIVWLDPEGKPAGCFGSPGPGRGQFRNLCGIQLKRGGTVAVADSGNNRVAVLSLDTPATSPIIPAAPMLQRIFLEKVVPTEIVDVTLGKDGKIYVLMEEDARVEVYDRKLQKKGVFTPLSQASKSKGSRITAGGKRVYISDSGTHRVHVYDQQGNFKFSFGQRGKEKGRFNTPGGIAVSDKVYIADSGNNRVQVFSLDGVYLSEISDPNIDLTQPVDVALTSDGKILVADAGNNRIVSFKPDDRLAGVLAGPDANLFGGLKALKVDADGRICVLTGDEKEKVLLLDSEGKLLMRFGTQGSWYGDLNDPKGMDVKYGSIYIADSGNGRLAKFVLMDVPAEPSGLTIVSSNGFSTLHWNANTETSLGGYRIYAVNDSGKKRVLGKTKKTNYSIPIPLEGGESKFTITGHSRSGLESNPAPTITDWGRLGLAAQKKGDHVQAVEYFRKAIENNPENHFCVLQLGLTFLKLERLDEADTYFEKLTETKEWAIASRLGLGKIALKKGDLLGAEEQFKRALALDSQNSETRICLAETLIARRKWQQALDNAREAANLAPLNSHAHEILGLAYYHQRLYGKAEKAMLMAISLDSSDPKLHYELAEVYIARGDKAAAKVQLEKALEVDPKFIKAGIVLGTLLLEIGEIDSAREQADNVIKLDPQAAGGYLLKGKVLFAKGDREGAIESFRKAMSINPDNPDAYANLAGAYLGLGEAAEADRVLTEARSRFPKDRDISILTAEVRQAQNDLSGALEALSKAIAIDSDCIRARLLKGRLHIKRKEYQSAAKEFAHVARLSPDDVNARIEWAEALKLAGKKTKAEEVLVDAVNIDPSVASAHFALGSLWAQMEDYDRALPELKLAAYTAPDNPLYHHMLGKAYIEAGELDGAVEALRRALELDPKNDVIRRDLDMATASRAKYRRSANVPPVEIAEVRIEPAYAAIHKIYDSSPVGKITLRNNSREAVFKVKVSFQVKRYQPTPTTTVVDRINPRKRQEIPLKAAFGSKLLDLRDDTPAIGVITVEYHRKGAKQRFSTTVPFTIHARNAIIWSNRRMVGAFVTPTDWPVGEFARQTVEAVGETPQGLIETLHKSVTIFEALGAYRMGYLEDPNRPFSAAGGEVERIDTVQYPRDTLRLRHGDCDDLSVLYSSMLENLGVQTAMALVPGHILVLVNSGLAEEDMELLTDDENLVIVHEGKVWIPVETTLVGSGFTEAWVKGAEFCADAAKQGKLEIVPLEDAWKVYPPAGLKMTQWLPDVPPPDVLTERVSAQENILLARSIDKQVAELLAAIEAEPDNPTHRLSLGILYAHNDRLDEALEQFQAVLEINPKNPDAVTNIGNVHYIKGEWEAALDSYSAAEQIKPDDAEIKINLSLVYYRLGDLEKAKAKFNEAAELDQDLADENGELKKLLYH